MALNCSHHRICSSRFPDDNIVSPLRLANGYAVEGVSDKGESFVRPCHCSIDLKDSFDCGRARVSSPELASRDILDLLPSDPFGMDVGVSTTFTAITGWFGDLKVDYGGFDRDRIWSLKEDYGFVAGLNLIWNNAVRLGSFSENMLFVDTFDRAYGFDRYAKGKDMDRSLGHVAVGSVFNMKDMPHINSGRMTSLVTEIEDSKKGSGSCSEADEGAPHEAFFFALSFLGTRDLLRVEQVCRSLRHFIRTDPLLWRTLHIDLPINEKITDDILLQLTMRAGGNLRCLRLVGCPWITDTGLGRVLGSNPKLTSLCVPGCTRLTIKGIMKTLRDFTSAEGTARLKQLRIGGIYGMTDELFEELKVLLKMDSFTRKKDCRPHYYSRPNCYILCDDDRAIDIEPCPICQNLRLVYDCTLDDCRSKDNTPDACRACTICIRRCSMCGGCIVGHEYEETFSFEVICLDCFKRTPHYQQVPLSDGEE